MVLFGKKEGCVSENVGFLRKVVLFENLRDKDLEIVCSIIHEREFVRDEVVFDEGEEGLGIYFVKQGCVKVLKGDREIAVLKDGDFFGELALLDGDKRSASVVAGDDTVLLGMFRPDFMSLIQDHSRVGMVISLALARVVAHRLRQTLNSHAG